MFLETSHNRARAFTLALVLALGSYQQRKKRLIGIKKEDKVIGEKKAE